MLLTLAMLALSTSIDSIGIGIAYGIRKIKISPKATVTLWLISFAISTLAIIIGKVFGNCLPPFITNWLGSIILIFMGFILLCQALKEPASYDIDNSKHIDSKEAITLGIALSLDSFSIGIGAGILTKNFILLFPFLVSFFQIIFLSLGKKLGIKLKSIVNIPSYFWNIFAAILLIVMGLGTGGFHPI